MISYGIVLCLVAAAFGVVARLIGKGRTDLIHHYHQTHVTDKEGYAKAVAKAMWVMAGTMALSGIIGMLGDSGWYIGISLGVLFLGFVLGIIGFARAQKKYNGTIL